uniref:Reverse transcriptase domain-containing protein n=2 Tax=Trichogramma kaykai TaxID=54128 RepID=A0ABD2VRE4_9HYME
MGRSRLASEELLVSAVGEGFDVLLIQEPYAYGGRACALGSFSRVVITGQKGDETPWAAVVVLSQSITATHLQQYSSAHCVCVELSGAFGSVVVISQYHQFSHEPGVHVDYLDLLLSRLGSRRVIIGMDLNGTSPQWSCRVRAADERGLLLEEVIHRHGLAAVYQPGHPSTLVCGDKDVDVTLVTSELEALVGDWTVREGWTTADHRPITYCLRERAASGVSRTPRYNVRRANWGRYGRGVSRLLEEVSCTDPASTQEVDALAQTLSGVLLAAAETAIPKKRFFPRSVPWWNAELTGLKRAFNRARRRYQGERDPQSRAELRARSNLLRRKYTRACWVARNASWQSFVATNTSGDAYGFIYKMTSEKIAPRSAVNSLMVGDSSTTGWSETAAALLDGFFADPTTQDRVIPPSQGADVDLWSELEVSRAVGSMKSGKCPGEDLIEADMVKVACGYGFLRPLTRLMNACLRLGRFPSGWKSGAICVLLKSPDKDRSALKSYRPVCLLPVLSKVLERLIRWRLLPVISNEDHASSRQFGFRAERCTADAIGLARSIVSDSEKPLAFGILFDITGAFDNLRWDSVMEELATRSCPGNLWWLIRDYLADRTVSLTSDGSRVVREVKKGAPQGSILGPDMWNMCMDPVLREVQERGGEIVAYADDLLLLVTGGSRTECEVHGQSMTDVISGWASRLCLEISRSKTEMILLKNSNAKGGKRVTAAGKKRLIERGNLTGSLLKVGKGGARPPCVRISEGESGIRYKNLVRYLGVTLGPCFSIAQHIEITGAKASGFYQRLASVARAQWGISYGAMRHLYVGVFLPTMLYAVTAWGDLVTDTLAKKLVRMQRIALLRICRAYRTASTASLQVCTGLLPLDLESIRWRLRAKIKRGASFELYGIAFREGDDKRQALERVETRLLDLWEERWLVTPKGEATKRFFPRIECRIGKDFIELDHYVSQFLTGHGDFSYRLHAFNLAESPLCSCGADDTDRHVLLECERLEASRIELRECLARVGSPWPPDLSTLVETKEVYGVFRRTCRALLLEKRRLDVGERNRA